MTTDRTDSVEQRVFLALADPTRRLLLEKLSAGGSRTATELAQEMPITRQGISKHLQILARAELVQVHQSGRDRIYSFRPNSLGEAVDWVTAINDQWDRRLQALGRFLDEEQNASDGG